MELLLIIKQAKKRVHLGGNIGYPVCSLVNKCKDGDILVLEISGHQLHDCYNFKTNVSVMTNLSEVHIDHFGTYENYKDNKAKIFMHHTKDDLAIYNIGNEDVVDKVKNIKSTKVSFTSQNNIKSDLYLKDDAIYYHDEKIIDTKDIKLQGKHNYENIMCMLGVVKEFNIPDDIKQDVCLNILEQPLDKLKDLESRNKYLNWVHNTIKFTN